MERPSNLSNAGHVAGFVAGGALAYNGMAPLFTSAREGDEGYERSAGVARRMGMVTEEGEVVDAHLVVCNRYTLIILIKLL